MMTKFECNNCCELNDFHTAFQQPDGKWLTMCPVCQQKTEIDPADYLVDIGTEVRMCNNEVGHIKDYDMHTTTGNFNDIVYIIDRGKHKSECYAPRKCFEIQETWKHLKRMPEGHLERICHYPRNQTYGNVPCFNCVDRTKCNADIFETLAQYESSDLQPDEVAKFKLLKARLEQANMTVEELIANLQQRRKN